MIEAYAGIKVAINALQVRYVMATNDPKMCGVYFDKDNVIAVRGSIGQVIEDLRSVLPYAPSNEKSLPSAAGALFGLGKRKTVGLTSA